jgi:hypothetical protein
MTILAYIHSSESGNFANHPVYIQKQIEAKTKDLRYSHTITMPDLPVLFVAPMPV